MLVGELTCELHILENTEISSQLLAKPNYQSLHSVVSRRIL